MDFILLVGLVTWFICGLIAMAISDSKGNGACGGFILGFLLGPLGILVAAVSPVNPQHAELQQKAIAENRVRIGELKKCPYCAELIQREAIVCRYCGRGIDVGTLVGASVPKRETASHGGLRITNRRIVYRNDSYALESITSVAVEGTGTNYWIRIKTSDGHERELGHFTDRQSAKQIAGLIHQQRVGFTGSTQSSHYSTDRQIDATSPQIQTPRNNCRQCGAPNPPGFRFCSDCGTPVFTPQQEPDESQPPREQ